MKVGIYYPTWNAPWASKVHELDLANIDTKYPGLNWVFISFAKPDLVYKKGQNSFQGTGLDFSMDFQIVKEAIALLRSRNICVMLSVGGATYWSSQKQLNTLDIANLVEDLGCNGVDVDYEAPGDGKILTAAIKAVKKDLPKDCYLSMAAWSTGAYASDGHYAGSAIDACKNAPLDLINIMAYDAGASYNPQDAWMAYKKIFSGALMMGFEVGQQGWGNYLLTEQDVKDDGKFVRDNCTNEDGAFVWCDKKEGNPSPQNVINTLVSIFNGPGTPSNPNTSVKSIVCPVCSTKFTSL